MPIRMNCEMNRVKLLMAQAVPIGNVLNGRFGRKKGEDAKRFTFFIGLSGIR